MKKQDRFNLMCADVFSEYKNIYKVILANIYPAKNSTGFPERNLSVNFSKAYEKVANKNGQCAYTWFEFQFGEKNNKHIDALIINDGTKEIFIIEAKRYSNPQEKKEEICKDINRMHEFIKDLEGRLNADGTNRFDYNFYGVILADVWTETEEKENVLNFYKKKQVDKNEFCKFFQKEKQFLSCVSDIIFCDVQSFESLEKYNLVSIWWNFSDLEK